MKIKHFDSDYNKLVKDKLKSNNKHDAMAQSIGDNFYHFGVFQKELLFQYGLKNGDTILDFGCGSGRLAYALKELRDLGYIGIDVVEDLLDYAKNICQRKDWDFIKSTDFKFDIPNNKLDMISCFSVFTHLLHEETFAYLAEMRRVLKPGGKIIFSFLDFSIPEHWSVFVSNLLQLEDRVHLNQFIDSKSINVWCDHLQLDILDILPGNEPYILLDEQVTDEKGNVFNDKVSLGQSVCVLQKPTKGSEKQIHVSLPCEFNAKRYLELNPDVANSGISPEVHYISWGQFENRPIK